MEKGHSVIVKDKEYILEDRVIVVYYMNEQNNAVRFIEYTKDPKSDKVYKMWSLEHLRKLLKDVL